MVAPLTWKHAPLPMTGTVKLPNSAFHISKINKLISAKFLYFLPYIYTTSLKEVASVFLKIIVTENYPIFLTFFFFSQNYKYI